MAERRENSVLFSLKELRRIEDDRVKKEEEDARARIEADRQAKEAAVRAARDDDERRKREEEDRLRRIEEDKENKTREEQFRLQEAERRHRVEGELKLQEERMRLEVHARSGKSPVKAIIGVTVVLVAVAGGLGYKMYTSHQAALQVVEARADELERQKRTAQADFDRAIAAIQKQMADKLAAAHSEEERIRIRAEAQAATGAVEARRHRPTGGTRTVDRPETPTGPGLNTKIKKREITDNPLDGLDTK